MRIFVASLLLASLLLSGCKHPGTGPGVRASATGSPTSLRADQAVAAKRQAELLNAATTEMETDVPAAAQSAIPTLKDALVQLSDDVMAGQPATVSAAQVEQALRAVLPSGKAPDDTQQAAAAKAAGTSEYDIPERGDYGTDLRANVSALRPGILLVDESFGVMCGEDNLLLGYSNASGRWRRVLRWQAAPYKQVSGAFGDIFQPQWLTVQRNGHPVLLVVHGTPWCTSTESGFAMDTFEVDPGSSTGKPFWHGEHSYRRADEMFTSKNTSDGFEIRTSVDDRIGDGISREGILRYALVGQTMQRALPIAMNSRESVSEWLDMPRNEAALFTDAPPGSDTWKLWSALTYQGKSTDDAMKVPTLSYGEVRACREPKHFQVELSTEVYSSDTKSRAAGLSEYFQVVETGSGYRIHEASPQADANCTGRVIALKSSGGASQSGTQ